ncbi:hypothetical protein PUN28_008670 [Cardiocondyla obscurior]|uniref:Uncharacterized protein n=1 Tax=Cardiocondyla obscurior TaxID=286306 RepID=A0AAW2G1T1_9HYME
MREDASYFLISRSIERYFFFFAILSSTTIYLYLTSEERNILIQSTLSVSNVDHACDYHSLTILIPYFRRGITPTRAIFHGKSPGAIFQREIINYYLKLNIGESSRKTGRRRNVHFRTVQCSYTRYESTDGGHVCTR